MDDACCTIKKGTAEGLFEHLKRLQQSILFPLELKKDGSFLNTHFRKKKDGTYITIYQKLIPHQQVPELLVPPSNLWDERDGPMLV